VTFTPLDEIARLAVQRWEKEGVVGGYTHLKDARADIKTSAKA
jgi:UDP-glucose 4-epimerase